MLSELFSRFQHKPEPVMMAEGVDSLLAAHEEIASLRGVTDATADLAECNCPDMCERDHANE